MARTRTRLLRARRRPSSAGDRRRAPLTGDVRRVVVARFVSHLGGAAGFFVGLWGTAAYRLDATATSLALLMAGLSVAQLVGSAAAGVLVDRLDPRRVLLLGEIAFVPAILLLTQVTTMGGLSVLAPLAWVASAFVMTAVASFPPFLASDARGIERANALVEAAGTISFILGPVVGALIVRLADLPAVFVLDAATSLVAVAIVVPVRVRDVHRERERRGFAELAAGFRTAYRTPVIALLLGLGTLTWMSFGTFSALEPLFYRDVLGVSAEVLGYVNAVFGAGMSVGALLLDRSAGRLTAVRTVVALTVAGGVGAILYVGSNSLVIVVAGAAFWGTTLGVLMPLLRTLTHVYTPETHLGRVTGVFNVHHSVGELLPLAIAPALAAMFGVRGVLGGIGVVMIAVAPLAWPRAARLDLLRPATVDPDRDVVDRIGDVEDWTVAQP